MKTIPISILFISFISFNAISAPVNKGLIIYSAVLKQLPSLDFTGLNHRQPDSVFFSVFFENSFSLSYFTLTSRQYPKDFEFSGIDQYSLNFIDSNYSIRKNILCNTKYKIPFQKRGLVFSGDTIMISGIKCLKYFTIGSFDDTTFYFVTKEFCKSAGIKIGSDMPDCIVGIESSVYKIFPVLIDKSLNYITTTLKEVPKNILQIQSATEMWIDSPVGEIFKTNPFPAFFAKDIKRETLTQENFKTSENSCTVVLMLNYIKFCNDYDPSLAAHYANGDNQSREMLDALDKLALEKKTKYFVITQDYWENIKDINYANLHIIPNGADWLEKLMIFSYPLFAIVDNKGIVKDFISIFDLDNSMNYFDGLNKLINLYSEQ